MGEYTDLAREYAEQFKPIIEEKTGIKLENLIVEEGPDFEGKMSSGGKFDDNAPKFKFAKIKVNEVAHTRMENKEIDNYFWECRSKEVRSRKSPLSRKKENEIMEKAKELAKIRVHFDIQTSIMHELSHLVHWKMIWKKRLQIKTREYILEEINPYDKIFSIDYDNRSKFYLCFIEGFATYMSLDNLEFLYKPSLTNLRDGKEILRDHLSDEREMYSKPVEHNPYRLDYDPYSVGYKFFKEILKEIGTSKLLELATLLPKNKTEMIKPRLYLKRILSLPDC